MKISSNFNQTQQMPVFKKGLTTAEINAVKRMKQYEFMDVSERLKNNYNIDAYFGESNTVAWCVEQVVKIMKKAGFQLPKNFAFCPLNNIFETHPLGIFIKERNLICINSDYSQFKDLRAQNELEESQGSYHPNTKHFLHTYLHEFSHAAHFNNIKNKYGEDRAIELFLGTLENHTPDEALAGPLNFAIKNKLPKFGKDIIDSVFPPSNGLYCLENLKEYFAEKNARELASQLGNNYNPAGIIDNFERTYQSHPANWNIIDRIKDFAMSSCRRSFPFGRQESFFDSTLEIISDAVNLCNREIAYTDGDIYHGNIDNLNKKFLIK